MPTIKELHNLYLSELETKLKESELLLQKQEGGLDGELKTSGWICEQFVRQTLERYIVPGQFRLTSGFIATPKLLSGQQSLPQCDILIVDRYLPPLLRLEGTGVEVVPWESVCGIIEVKRSLNAKNIRAGGVFSHIASIVESLGESKDLKTDRNLNMANRHVFFHNHSSDKLLLGVIALKNDMNSLTETVRAINDADSLVDFVCTTDGHGIIAGFEHENQLLYYAHTARPETKTWGKLRHEDFSNTGSPFYRMFKGSPVWCPLGFSVDDSKSPERDAARVLAQIRGVLSLMFSRICSQTLGEEQINDYYLRPFTHPISAAS
jgi:hypothetical protein